MKENKDEEVFRIIVCGSKDFCNYDLLKKKCDYYISSRLEKGNKIEIISGGAKGAESLGEKYAKEKGYSFKIIPIQWDKYGKRAGYLRNSKMAEISNACIAFLCKDEESKAKGIEMMINIAREKHLLVREVISKNDK